MIKINQSNFHKTRRESIDSETDGYFRTMKKSIDFYNHEGDIFASLVHADTHNPFFVSSCRRDGRKWYSFGLSDAGKRSLGLGGRSYRKENDIAVNLASEFRLSLVESRKVIFTNKEIH